MRQFLLDVCVITAIVLAGTIRGNCQNSLPEVFEKGTIPEQIKYLDEHTRIYDNYRAIREDMYRTFSTNAVDTLTNAKSKMNGFIIQNTTLNNRIDSLKKSLEASDSKLLKATRTKDSISILGMEVNKIAYNSIMWTILAALGFLLIIGYLSFKQNRIVTLRTKKDLNELREEFEEYQKKNRLEREKMNLDHFNEIKRLKRV
jgi:hypothetical protein